MNGNILSLIACMLMITSTIGAASESIQIEKTFHPLARGNTLYVGGNGPNNYTKIQDAINAAVTNDTVFVYADSSPYKENLNVSKSISMTGEDWNTTIIDGSIFIHAVYVTVSGFTIQHKGFFGRWASDGIRLYGNYCTIKGIIVQNNNCGIGLFGGNQNRVLDNIIRKNRQNGISSASGYITNTNCTISGNFVTENGFVGIGIIGNNNTICRNNVPNNHKIGIWAWGNFNNVTENTVQNCTRQGSYIAAGIYIEGENNIITRNNLMNNSRQAFQSDWARNYTEMTRISQENNVWDSNYWGVPLTKPNLITGRILLQRRTMIASIILGYRWIAYDSHPAQEPYTFP